MRKIVLILSILLPFFCNSQNTWFNMYPRGDVQVAPTITITSATARYTSIYVGYSTTLGTPTATEAGFCWNTTGNPTTYDNTKSENVNSGADDITGLTHNTTYYIRAYIISTMGTYYSNQITRTTLNGLPVVATAQTPSSIGSTTAECGGQVSSSGGASVTDMGMCWSSSNSNPTLSDSHASKYVGDETGFVAALSGLSQNTLYYFRAYATNSFGNGYGSVYNFTTTSGAVIPTVSTASITNITSSTASSGGNVTSDGGVSVVNRGIEYTTDPSFVSGILSVPGGSGTGSFTSYITGLSPSTTYYVRAFAANSIGTSYGAVYSFTTNAECILPSFIAASCGNITASSIDATATISSDGGCTVTSRGFQYSTDASFNTVLGSVTASGTGTGQYSATISGLTCGVHYYFRPWATNSIGTFYATSLVGSGCITDYPPIDYQSITAFTTMGGTYNGTTYPSFNISTQSDAILACNIYNLGTVTSSTSGEWKVKNFAVGETAYFSCNVMSISGYRFIIYNGSSYVVSFNNGSIQSIHVCSPTLNIGDSYGGGIIAYIFKSGDPGYISGQVHGIIAAASDIAGNLPWATYPFLITNATSFELSDGDNNTTIIVAVNGTTTTYAARICDELSLNGYSDWCLPSMNELLKLSYNKLIIGGFSSLFYWSSTELDRYTAYGVNFSGIGSNKSSKGGSARVRAIRYF